MTDGESCCISCGRVLRGESPAKHVQECLGWPSRFDHAVLTRLNYEPWPGSSGRSGPPLEDFA